MIYAIKRDGETNEKLVNRFKKQSHWFRLVPKVRAARYNRKKPTKRLARVSALKREEYRAKRRRAQLFA